MTVGLDSHQRLVNTTPKPRATKNNSGELEPPLLRSGVGVIVGGWVTVAEAVAVLATMLATWPIISWATAILKCCEAYNHTEA